MFLSINKDTFKCNRAKRNEETKEGRSNKTLTTKVKACITKKMVNNLIHNLIYLNSFLACFNYLYIACFQKYKAYYIVQVCQIQLSQHFS